MSLPARQDAPFAMPILIDHDPHRLIGHIEFCAQGITVNLLPGRYMTSDEFRNTFGTCGFKLLEAESIDGAVIIKRAIIFEYSLSELGRQFAAVPA